MTREQIIEDARILHPWFEEFADSYPDELTAALDTVALNGFYDDMLGDVSSFGLFYLIDCCILRVDDHGNTSATAFVSVESAEQEWTVLAREYEDWCWAHEELIA